MASNTARGLNCGISTRPGALRAATCVLSLTKLTAIADLPVQRTGDGCRVVLTRTAEHRTAIAHRFDHGAAYVFIRARRA